MKKNLDPIPVQRKSGEEAFHSDGTSIGGTLKGFWQWSGSNLIGNTERGGVAEYLVAMDLGVHKGVQPSWFPFDLLTRSGIKVEVKSAAYIQEWKQRRYSKINFRIAPTFAWDPQTNEFEEMKRRQADVYVFAVLVTKDQDRLDPMDVSQWEFHVLPSERLNQAVGDQESISLSRVQDLGAISVPFGRISGAIEHAMESVNS